MFHQRWQTSKKFRFFISRPNLCRLIKYVNLLLRKMMPKETSKLRWLYNVKPIKWTEINVSYLLQLISPSGKKTLIQLNQTDPERLYVRVAPSEVGGHKIHIRFNAVEIPQSPLKFEVCGESCQTSQCSTFFLGFRSTDGQITFFLLPIQNYRFLALMRVKLNIAVLAFRA